MNEKFCINNDFDSKLTFKPLISNNKIFCHLLTIDKTKIVIDCGIDKNFDYSIYTEEIKIKIEEADCILITSFDIYHFGAVGLFKNKKIYCSVPTAVLGKTMLDNAFEKQKYLKEESLIFNDLNLNMIKFYQPFTINNLKICAYNGGNIIGNSLYKIEKDSDTIALGYNLNHRKENYLNGISDYFPTDIFITNSKYCECNNKLNHKNKLINENNYINKSFNLKDQNEIINKFIKNSKNKVVITISITRLIELLLIIKNNAVVISNINFMDRVKSMIEWAGSKSTSIFEISILFRKASKINKKVIIIISDYLNDIYLGEILEKLSGKCILLRINENEPLLECKKYKVNYKKEKLKNKKEKEKETMKKQTEKKNWYDLSDTIFVKHKKDKFLFPKIKRQLIENNYGIELNFKFEEIPENIELNENNIENVVEHEKITFEKDLNINLKSENNSLNIDEYFYRFYGISDLNSIKTVLERFSPKNLVIVNDNYFNSKFMTSFLNLNDKFKTFLCDKELFFNLSKNIYNVKISDQISNLNFQQIGNKKIASCFIKRENDSIFIENNISKLKNFISNIEIIKLKKILNDKNFIVEINNNELIVEDKLIIKIDKKEITINSENSYLLLSVRDTLFKFISMM